MHLDGFPQAGFWRFIRCVVINIPIKDPDMDVSFWRRLEGFIVECLEGGKFLRELRAVFDWFMDFALPRLFYEAMSVLRELLQVDGEVYVFVKDYDMRNGRSERTRLNKEFEDMVKRS